MKDTRNYTLGELLDSTDSVIYRNAMSIHKRLRQTTCQFCGSIKGFDKDGYCLNCEAYRIK